MMYVDFTAGEKTYKLRLATRNIVALEKAIGRNPVSVFGMSEENMRIPTVTEMVHILHNSLQKFQHGITINDAQDIFDAYLEDHNMTDFVQVITDIYKVSGIMRDPKEELEEEKNVVAEEI